MQGAEPVEDLDGGGHGNEIAEQGEHHAREQRLSGDEHVVAPDEECDHRDGNAGPDDELVAEQLLAGEYRNDLRHDAEAGQDHDVDRGMRVEPEQMLEQQRVATQPGIEHADMEHGLEQQQQQRDRQNRRCQHEDDAGRIQRPDEYRQAIPGQARRAQAVNGDDEIQSGGDGGKTGNEDADHHRDDMALGIVAGQRRVECPAGIDAAGEQRVQRAEPAGHEQIPAHQVQLRKRQVPRAQHQRDHEVADGDRHGGHQEEPHHDDAVHGEQPVVGLG